MVFGLQKESSFGGISRLILTLVTLCAVFERCTATRYAIVVDAGSTGTRAFVFQEVYYEEERIIQTFPCGKERMGLSSYAANLTSVAELFIPLLRTAAKNIPVNYHRITSLFVRGTAGMRLLSDGEQNALWDSLVFQLKNRRDIPFHIDRKNFGTISGYQEAFYAVLASNYIVGSIDGNRKLIEGASLIGALDMGGSSNQLVIYNGSNPKAKIETDHFWSYSWLRYGAEMMRERLLRHIYEAHINSDMLLQNQIKESTSIKDSMHDNSTSTDDGIIRLPNPCAFENYVDTYIDNILFIGTGDSKECIQLIERVVWAAAAVSDSSNSDTSSSSDSSDTAADGELITDEITGDGRIQTIDTTTATHATARTSTTTAVEDVNMEENLESTDDNDEVLIDVVEEEDNMNNSETTTTIPSVWGCSHGPCAIDDIYHPSVQGHKFYAMSVYYYALDCVRQLGPEPLPHWPTPSIAELRAATDRFCALPWDYIQHRYDSATGPQYTYPSQLPYRCLEALYIVTLLEKGFGFDPHGRSITLALEVGGKEVEWTLGYALAEVDFAPAAKVAHLEALAKITTPLIEELNEAREQSQSALLSYITLMGNAVKMLGSVTKEAFLTGKILYKHYDTFVGRFVDAWTWK